MKTESDPAQQAEDAKLPGSRRTVMGLAFMLILTAVTVWLMVRQHDTGRLLDVLREADPRYIAAGLGLMVLFMVSEGFAILTLLRALGYQERIGRCVKYAVIGFYYAGITPGGLGGQPARIVYMKRDGIRFGDATLCTMTNMAAYQVGILLICLTGLIAKQQLLISNLGIVKYLALLGGVVNILVLGIIIGSAVRIDFMKRLAGRVIAGLARIRLVRKPQKLEASANRQLERYSLGARTFAAKPGAILLAVILMTAQILARLSVAVLVYRAFHLEGYAYLDIVALGAFLALGTEFLPLPGGVGAAEAGFLRINREIFGQRNLVSAALLTRGISLYAALVLSGLAAVAAHLLPVRRPAVSPPDSPASGAGAG